MHHRLLPVLAVIVIGAPLAASGAQPTASVPDRIVGSAGVEEPPTRLLQLAWTGDDGWVCKVRPEGEIGSVDYSPQGQYALFASNSGYGRPHHLTSYHPDLGWRDLVRPELPLNTGEDLIAAINDTGSVLTVRSGGYEEEPGSWAVTTRSLMVGPRGRLRDVTEQAWPLPADPTVDVVASAENTSITLGSMIGPDHPALAVQYAVRAPDATPRR